MTLSCVKGKPTLYFSIIQVHLFREVGHYTLLGSPLPLPLLNQCVQVLLTSLIYTGEMEPH